MSAATVDTVLVACSVLKAEIEELHRKQLQNISIRFISSMLHMEPDLLEKRLELVISEEKNQRRQTLLVYGDCCPGMTGFEASPGVARTPCHNCCELLLGTTEYKRLEHEGVFFLIPEWTQRWREIFSDELGLNQENARDLMGEMHRKLMYLDTGLVPVPLEELQACSAYVGLPYEIMPIGLDNLATVVTGAIKKLESRETPFTPIRYEADSAFNIMTMDVLKNVLSRADNPKELGTYLTEEVREITGARFVILVRYIEGQWSSLHSVVGICPERNRALAESYDFTALCTTLSQTDTEMIWSPDDGSSDICRLLGNIGYGLSLSIPLTIGNERTGLLLALGLPDRVHIEQVTNLLKTLSPIIALVLQNATLFEQQEHVIQERTRELRNSQKLFHAIIDKTTDLIFVKDQAGRYILANAAVAGVFKKPVDEIIGKDDASFFPPDEASRLMAEDHEIMAQAGTVSREKGYTTSNGIRTYLTNKGPIHDESGIVVGLFGILRDITERKHLEEQLRQSQKMEAVGRLAGGVAHDFNNILTVIMGYSNLLLMDNKLDDHQRGEVNQILSSIERATQLTKGLLAFSRKQVMEPKNTDLNEIVRHVQKFICRVIGEDIQFQAILNQMPLPVKVDRGQIEQVLINLATNARDAMQSGGALIIETGLQEIDASYEKSYGYGKPGHYACITVSDTGCGMDEETRNRIFEPFFTTKEVGKGTGLGMAIVYGVVKQHNGFINVYSEPSQGTSFRIYLPIIEPELAPLRGNGKQLQEPPRGGTETILLVEDDATVRKLAVAILVKYGYDIIQAVDGQDAVEQFTANRNRIRLIIMDMIMPKKNGKEAYDEICRIQPGVKVLYSSGYTADFIASRGVSEEGIELLMKPVQPVELLRKVREMLDAK